MKKNRKINELPEGLKNRMLRLTFEHAVLTNRNPRERMEALDQHCITYKMWQTRSFHLMRAINEKLAAEGKPEKYEFKN
jgi:hypothetical protein